MKKFIVILLFIACKSPKNEWVSLIKNNSLDFETSFNVILNRFCMVLHGEAQETLQNHRKLTFSHQICTLTQNNFLKTGKKSDMRIVRVTS